MPNNEVDRSFPQPPRRYDGPLLDPMLVEEDYDETVGMVRRFAARNPAFTEEILIAHLALKNGVMLYGTQEDWDALFAEMRAQIVEEAAKKKPPVHVSWMVQRIGETAAYTMVEESSAAPAGSQAAVEVSPAVVTDVDENTEVAPEAEEVNADQPTFNFLLHMLSASEEGLLLTRDVRRSVAVKFRVSLDEADRRIQSAVSAGVVRRGSQRGTSAIRLTPKRNGQEPDANEENEEEVAQVEALDELDKYFKVIRYVMQALSALRDISMGQPYDKLWNRSSLEEDMDFEEFKRYVRRMEVDGLVRIEKDAKLSTKTARSKILRGTKVFAASAAIKGSWKVNGRENWKAMYEAALHNLLEEHAE